MSALALEIRGLRSLSRGCLLLFVSVIAGIQPSWPQGAQPAVKEAALPVDQIKKTVVFIHGTYDENGIPKNWDGTGFFIFHTDPLL